MLVFNFFQINESISLFFLRLNIIDFMKESISLLNPIYLSVTVSYFLASKIDSSFRLQNKSIYLFSISFKSSINSSGKS